MNRHIGFVLALAFLPLAPAKAQVLDQTVAVIGDLAVFDSDVRERSKDYQRSPQLAQLFGFDPKSIDPELVKKRLIDDRVVSYVTKSMGIAVSDAEVETQIGRIASQNRMDRKTLEESLAREGVPMALYKENIRSQLERRNIFDGELRAGGGPSESELRAQYEQSAPLEVTAALITRTNSSANRADLNAVSKRLQSKSSSAEEEISRFNGVVLEWTPVDSLHRSFALALKKNPKSKTIGPVLIEGKLQFLIVLDSRRGSEEGFQRAKSRLAASTQAEDFDQRLNSWIAKKREELQVIVPPASPGNSPSKN